MRNLLLIFLMVISNESFSQSKIELQNYIVSDLKKSSGTWKSKSGSPVYQIEKNYTFSISNCDLTITSDYTSNGSKWNKMKMVIKISDINNVRIVNTPLMTTGLMIETMGHSISRYCDGKLLDFDNSTVMGLGTYDIEIDSKYLSLFRRLSKYCN